MNLPLLLLEGICRLFWVPFVQTETSGTFLAISKCIVDPFAHSFSSRSFEAFSSTTSAACSDCVTNKNIGIRCKNSQVQLNSAKSSKQTKQKLLQRKCYTAYAYPVCPEFCKSSALPAQAWRRCCRWWGRATSLVPERCILLLLRVTRSAWSWLNRWYSLFPEQQLWAQAAHFGIIIFEISCFKMVAANVTTARRPRFRVSFSYNKLNPLLAYFFILRKLMQTNPVIICVITEHDNATFAWFPLSFPITVPRRWSHLQTVRMKALNEMTVSCTPVTSSYGVTSIRAFQVTQEKTIVFPWIYWRWNRFLKKLFVFY